MLTPIEPRGFAVVDPYEHVHVRGHFGIRSLILKLSSYPKADRSDSWDAFLCHSSHETFDAAIPRSMLAVYPASVAKNTVIPYKDCRQFHRDFINDHWMVPDFICHKWFQGTCEYPNSCWNQHGMTFDSALRMAFNIQLASRGRHPPVQFRSDNGGTMRQINRKDAEQLIMTTMGDFRRRGVRKWRFGTHFTDFHRFDEWDYSSDAERICADYRRAQEAARLNDVPRGRSP